MTYVGVTYILLLQVCSPWKLVYLTQQFYII